jgi:hypothetical protein
VASLPATSFRRNLQPGIATSLAPLVAHGASSIAIQKESVRVRRSARIWSAAFLLGAAVALAFIGFAIGSYLDSPSLGLMGADIVFLLGVSVATSGQSPPRRGGS